MKYIALLLSNNLFARSIKGTIDNLGKEGMDLGLSLSIVGIIIAGASLLFGRQDAGRKVSQAIMAILLFVGAPAIVNFIKELVR